jgi:hypothetical protein
LSAAFAWQNQKSVLQILLLDSSDGLGGGCAAGMKLRAV